MSAESTPPPLEVEEQGAQKPQPAPPAPKIFSLDSAPAPRPIAR